MKQLGVGCKVTPFCQYWAERKEIGYGQAVENPDPGLSRGLECWQPDSLLKILSGRNFRVLHFQRNLTDFKRETRAKG